MRWLCQSMLFVLNSTFSTLSWIGFQKEWGSYLGASTLLLAAYLPESLLCISGSSLQLDSSLSSLHSPYFFRWWCWSLKNLQSASLLGVPSLLVHFSPSEVQGISLVTCCRKRYFVDSLWWGLMFCILVVLFTDSCNVLPSRGYPLHWDFLGAWLVQFMYPWCSTATFFPFSSLCYRYCILSFALLLQL